MSGSWAFLGKPAQAITGSLDGEAVVALSGGSVFSHGANAGGSWAALGAPPGGASAVAQGYGSVYAIGAGGAVYRRSVTTNDSWHAIAGVSAREIALTGEGYVVVAGQDGQVYSHPVATDSGPWKNLGEAGAHNLVAYDFNVFCLDQNNHVVYRDADGSNDWHDDGGPVKQFTIDYNTIVAVAGGGTAYTKLF